MTRVEYVKWLRGEIHKMSELRARLAEKHISTYDLDAQIKPLEERLRVQLDKIEADLTDPNGESDNDASEGAGA